MEDLHYPVEAKCHPVAPPQEELQPDAQGARRACSGFMSCERNEWSIVSPSARASGVTVPSSCISPTMCRPRSPRAASTRASAASPGRQGRFRALAVRPPPPPPPRLFSPAPWAVPPQPPRGSRGRSRPASQVPRDGIRVAATPWGIRTCGDDHRGSTAAGWASIPTH